MRRGIIANEWRYEPVHRISVFTEHGLSKSLVAEFFEKCKDAGCDLVLDPFVGSGTVLIEAQKQGLESVGVDSNPWALLVVKAKTSFPWGIRDWIAKYRERLSGQRPFVPSPRLKRYHKPSTLKALGKLRAAIEEAPPPSRPLLLIVLGEVAYEASKLRKSPAPKLGRSKSIIAPGLIFSRFSELLSRAVEDLEWYLEAAPGVHLIWADSTAWLPDRVEAVLTSPPFANNVDYIRHTQLQLMWSGIATDSEALGALRSMQVPSCEAAARGWKPTIDVRQVVDTPNAIKGKRRRGYVNFLGQYFYAMQRHFELLAERLEWEAWYTIGDSILGGAYVPTHEILANFAKSAGLKVVFKEVSERAKPSRKLYLLIASSRR